MKLTWKLINEIINKKRSRSELPDSFKEDEDTIISHPEQIADKFNEYFVNVGPNLAEKIPQNKVNYSTYLTDRKLNYFFLEATTENEVKNEMSFKRKQILWAR